MISKLNLQGNESLLDIGCGDGKITAALAKILKYGFVYGIDANLEMINFAKKNYINHESKNLTFEQMNAREIKLDQTFDVAFSNAVLHWVDDHVAVLKGVHAHLKPQGKILFQMGGKGNVGELRTVIEQTTQETEWQTYFKDFSDSKYFYDPEDYLKWLPETGFTPLRVDLIKKDMQHQGKEGLKGWLRTTWFTYTHQLREELREPFLDAVVNNYTQKVPIDEQGKTHVGMVRLEVEAVKI
ncbi:SAM-dependent methyltransferase [Aphanothece hegewaldii CCALA 016]|uniref:SAM-dependent methyltransferase n=1 Tax=Aphanothece hegewaldii CCALA 016 TaxID=2107694 RepID=A0A2T1LWY1_9CHRO|nr:SAM-dependent methyltransferase [Aphanothece hegewaldii CCALA 016]